MKLLPDHDQHERERIRALRALASAGADGCTVAMLVTRQIDPVAIDDLVGCGLVAIHQRRERAWHVAWAVITDDGRKALESSTRDPKKLFT